MPKQSFGAYLKMIRTRQNGTQLAKNVGISYVYLLDIEKGARPVPRKQILMALADNLNFRQGEREKFFDLAAEEKGEVPVDVCELILDNRQLTNLLRDIKKSRPSDRCWEKIQESVRLAIEEDRNSG